MTRIATQLAKNLIAQTSQDLYIDVERIDKDIIHVSYRYKGKNKGYLRVGVFDMMNKNQENPKVPISQLSGEIFARLAPSQAKVSKGPCNNSYVVEYAVTNIPGGGWGRLLYYIAMHYAGNNGLIADRIKSSSDAVVVWNKLWSDSEIEKRSLDNVYDPKTADPNDDCNLASSGIYSQEDGNLERAKHSKEAHDWNLYLQGKKNKKEDAEQEEDESDDPAARQQRAEEYKKEKASKLNYTYISQSREAISLLNNAGKLAYNGKFAPKPAASLASSVKAPQAIREGHVLIYNLLFKD
jgi:hypothetical protein